MPLSSKSSPPVKLLLSDVDGTLVRPDKVLTDRTIAAVQKLYEAGIKFAITSSRPPRGMSMFIQPLKLSTPLAACNGAIFVNPDLTLISQKALARPLVEKAIAALERFGLDIWIYKGSDWFVRSRHGVHVDHQVISVQFEPTVVPDFQAICDQVAKIVGVSDDHAIVRKCREAMNSELGGQVSATSSQPHYLDITHIDANKGEAVKMLSRRFSIDPAAIATVGDGPNDVLMFKESGLSIAMGNGDAEVKKQATFQTESNENDGLALAIEKYVLSAVTAT
jgi:Cof subfamily protein (haloacid dehalogenase superfamily)